MNTLGENDKEVKFTVDFTSNGYPLYFLDGMPIDGEEVDRARKMYGAPEHDEVFE